jgi:OOP family OmpA-OmpF porin
MKKIIAIVALSAAITAPAFAADNNAYLTADLSSASYTNVGGFPTNPGKVGIGAGYKFNQNLAGEIGYHKFGDSTLTNGAQSSTLKVSSFTAAAVGSYPINTQFSAIGKLGLAMNKGDYTGNLPGVTPVSSNNTSLYFALGGQFNFNPQFAIRAQYENFGKIANNTPSNAKASALGAALVYNF